MSNSKTDKPNMISMNKTLRTITTALCALLLLPLSAREQADTVYTFRFMPGRDMFHVPYGGNDAELARLEECVGRHKADILSGKLPLRVDGYCGSMDSEAGNLAVARTRSNRVKSELITRLRLTEECFVTRNHSGGGDLVTVRLVVPVDEDGVAERRAEQERLAEQERAEKRAEQERLRLAEEKRLAREKELARLASERARADSLAKAGAERPAAEKAEATRRHALSLRANLLRWATLTPDLGVEWRVTPSVGVVVNGSWTSWTWNAAARRYALWEVSPEARYYMGEEKRGYLGAIYKAGEFHYKLSATGRQGDLMGGGITGGYQLRLNNALSLDFNLAVGCLHADYEKYEVIDGVRVRQGEESKNWWGPINAGVTLVWKLGK